MFFHPLLVVAALVVPHFTVNSKHAGPLYLRMLPVVHDDGVLDMRTIRTIMEAERILATQKTFLVVGQSDACFFVNAPCAMVHRVRLCLLRNKDSDLAAFRAWHSMWFPQVELVFGDAKEEQ